jgi:hypothetical protein
MRKTSAIPKPTSLTSVSVRSLRVTGCVSYSVLSCNDLLGEQGLEPSTDLVALEQAIATNHAALQWTPPLQ